MAKIKADVKLVEYIRQRRHNTDEELVESKKQTIETVKKHRKTCKALSNMEYMAKGEIAVTLLVMVIMLQRMLVKGFSVEAALYVVGGLALGIYVYYNVLRLKYLGQGLRDLLNYNVTLKDLKVTYKENGVTV